MVIRSFFNKPKEQSLVKSRIVTKYFCAWANVMVSTQKRYPEMDQKIAYIDLFAGPGCYEDGSKSTPLMILEKAVANKNIAERLICILNDTEIRYCDQLKDNLAKEPDIDALKNKPAVINGEVNEEVAKIFSEMKLLPTLLFVDPWGYKGISLDLIKSVVKDWGCDCILFFNYKRIYISLFNPAVKEHLDGLFGNERARRLREKVKFLERNKQELEIINELCSAINDIGMPYTEFFRFRDKSGIRISHHLIFISKDYCGYKIIKDIMGKESTSDDNGVPSFEYNPRDLLMKPLPFQGPDPIIELANKLLKEYSGKTVTTEEIFKQHSVGKRYLLKNYKKALQYLEKESKVTASQHKKNTFGDEVMVTFPFYRE